MTLEGSPRTGLGRRDALRLLAASTTTVAAGSAIISQPAHAANGSESCLPVMTPQATARIINQSGNGNRDDYLSISVAPNAFCPCGQPPSTPVIDYAYSIDIPGVGSCSTGWIDASAISVTSPSLWGNGGGSVTMGVWIRVTCGEPVQCHSGSSTVTVTGPNSNTSQTVPLGVDGTCSPPGTNSGGLQWTSGTGTPPIPELTADNARTGLAPSEPDATTTADEPGIGADTSDPTTTTTTTTTTTPTATSEPPSTEPPG